MPHRIFERSLYGVPAVEHGDVVTGLEPFPPRSFEPFAALALLMRGAGPGTRFFVRPLAVPVWHGRFLGTICLQGSNTGRGKNRPPLTSTRGLTIKPGIPTGHRAGSFVFRDQCDAAGLGECPEWQRGRTVNPLAYAFVGSSPTSPTSLRALPALRLGRPACAKAATPKLRSNGGGLRFRCSVGVNSRV